VRPVSPFLVGSKGSTPMVVKLAMLGRYGRSVSPNLYRHEQQGKTKVS